MQLHTLLFGNRGSYERMVNVLFRSVLKHSSNTPLIIHQKQLPKELKWKGLGRDQTVIDNTAKSQYFAELIQSLKNKDVVGLIDCDTMVINPLESIEKMDFDIGITWRPDKAKLMFNSGVVFVRVSQRIKDFYKEWADVATEMLESRKFFDAWRDPYGGVNQTSLGYMLEQKEWKKIKVLKLPCQEWNCENSTWHKFDPASTRIVHILGSLRHYVFGNGYDKVTPQKKMIAKLWHDFDKPEENK